MKQSARGWQEFWAEFFRIKHRHSIESIRDFDERFASHIIKALALHRGERILDLGCGGGDQAAALARRGMECLGVDIAQTLVDYANRTAREENLRAKFICADMREEQFREAFDACVILEAFGFFDDEGNTQVLNAVKTALKKDGRFYIQGPNPLSRMKKPWKGWQEVEDGYVLMESNYDPASGKNSDSFFYIGADGEQIRFSPKPEDAGVSTEMRLHTLPEMVNLPNTAQLRFKAAYGSIRLPLEEYTVTSDHLAIVGKKAH